MASPVLHYIYDPYCGWCYAAAPLLAEAHTLPGLELVLHCGGMLTGPTRRQVDRAWREYVLPHDQHIARLTGQRFGDGYFTGLLYDEGAVLDSAPPAAAVLAATTLGRGHDMLAAVQRAHFVDGQRVAAPGVLAEIACMLGLDPDAYAAAYEDMAGVPVIAHIAEARARLAAAGGQGFPCAVLAVTGRPERLLQLGPFLGRPEAWRDYLAACAAQR
ncbi:DsbA family protein [Verticiella sediminum]|uniref:DsbA family protein n=1 Tax=Verticiella sediminum TaxID=1247510 RepID=A0A556B0A6_9BURK|nr:DsbA family protein [Verticiella sediminum]TSH98621.1 DsbA family protein [Verticiella sediminum]